MADSTASRARGARTDRREAGDSRTRRTGGPDDPDPATVSARHRVREVVIRLDRRADRWVVGADADLERLSDRLGLLEPSRRRPRASRRSGSGRCRSPGRRRAAGRGSPPSRGARPRTGSSAPPRPARGSSSCAGRSPSRSPRGSSASALTRADATRPRPASSLECSWSASPYSASGSRAPRARRRDRSGRGRVAVRCVLDQLLLGLLEALGLALPASRQRCCSLLLALCR